MAKLIIIHIRKETNIDWIVLPYALNLFSEDEKVVLEQAYRELQAMPGYISTETKFLDQKKYQVINNFATLEDANYAMNVFKQSYKDTYINKRTQIINNKRKELGANYTVSMSVIE